MKSRNLTINKGKDRVIQRDVVAYLLFAHRDNGGLSADELATMLNTTRDTIMSQISYLRNGYWNYETHDVPTFTIVLTKGGKYIIGGN